MNYSPLNTALADDLLIGANATFIPQLHPQKMFLRLSVRYGVKTMYTRSQK